MSNVHKNPTISFRVSDYERREIEAKIKVSGMMKKDYFVRSCIYNHVCVVGKKENIYPLVEELHSMQILLKEVAEQFQDGNAILSEEGFEDMKTDFTNMIKALIWLLDGAKYLWMGKEEADKQD